MDPETVIQKHRTPDIEWDLAMRGPIAPLRGLVLSYQDYSERARGRVSRLEVPFAGVPVIISFDKTFTITDPAGRTEEHDNFAAGLSDSWVVVDSDRGSRGVQVNFTPIGARLFLGLPMSELTNRVLDLREILGPVVRSLPRVRSEGPRGAPLELWYLPPHR